MKKSIEQTGTGSIGTGAALARHAVARMLEHSNDSTVDPRVTASLGEEHFFVVNCALTDETPDGPLRAREDQGVGVEAVGMYHVGPQVAAAVLRFETTLDALSPESVTLLAPLALAEPS